MTVSEEGFDRLVEAFRTELLAYCSRMLGSAHDAGTWSRTVPEGVAGPGASDENGSSLRAWLCRIATNACLTALTSRGRRPCVGLVAASDPPGRSSRGSLAWLQPLPDSLLDTGDPAVA